MHKCVYLYQYKTDGAYTPLTDNDKIATLTKKIKR